MIKLFTKISQLLLPHTCILCGVSSNRHIDLCWKCQLDLLQIKKCCAICGTVLPDEIQDLTCGQCLKHNYFFDRTYALFQYQYPIKNWILLLKFQRQLLYARILGELYAEYIKNQLQKDNKNFPEVIIPVPTHPKRLRERGFNQALELAKPISKLIDLPIDYKSCQRIRHTESQSLVLLSQRRGNVKNAFYCRPNFLVKHVAIVDDVMTTGETVNALSNVLRKQGVEKIDIWCLARA